MSDQPPSSAPLFPAGAAQPEFRRALGPWHLTALGVGGIIGAGIFVITGQAAAKYAGPGVTISFALASLACLFAGLCYAEYAAMIPAAGSAYTYTRATLGRFLAWFIGWNLVLEYLFASAVVAAGWSGYFGALLADMGVHIPAQFASAPFKMTGPHEIAATGAWFNLPAVAVVAVSSAFLAVGIQATARYNVAMVAVKITIIMLVIACGLPFISAANLTPFIPPAGETWGENGWGGVLRATGIIFFAYLGFDAVSATAQEAKNPQRDVPLGIIGSLLICTVLYVLMALTLTGLAPYTSLNVANPVSAAMQHAGPQLAWLIPAVNAGAVAGLSSVVLVTLLGQIRIFYAMSRDGLLPPLFSAIHPVHRTPWAGTIVTGAMAALLAGLFPLDVLGELVSIGTLAAFATVCCGIMVLRVTAPEIHRPFRTPFVWIVAPAGVLTCAAMMLSLPGDTWVRLAVWTAVGLAIYFGYGVRHAKPAEWMPLKAPLD